MKKVLVCVMFLLLICGCQTKVEAGFNDVKVSKVLSMINAEDDFLLLVSSSDCYSCHMFEQDAEALFVDNDIAVYEINADNITSEEKNQLMITLGTYTSYPALFYIKDGVVGSGCRYEYSLNPERYETWLKNMKLIEK